MAELLPCPFCGGEAKIVENGFGFVDVSCKKRGCRGYSKFLHYTNKEKAISKWNTRTPKERGADKPKITCLNCKHLMFSDMYGECNKQLRIVNPTDTCEYAEPKERGEG